MKKFYAYDVDDVGERDEADDAFRRRIWRGIACAYIAAFAALIAVIVRACA